MSPFSHKFDHAQFSALAPLDISRMIFPPHLKFFACPVCNISLKAFVSIMYFMFACMNMTRLHGCSVQTPVDGPSDESFDSNISVGAEHVILCLLHLSRNLPCLVQQDHSLIRCKCYVGERPE